MFGSFKGFCLYRPMGVSVPSLHRESTDSLIKQYDNMGKPITLINIVFMNNVAYPNCFKLLCAGLVNIHCPLQQLINPCTSAGGLL